MAELGMKSAVCVDEISCVCLYNQLCLFIQSAMRVDEISYACWCKQLCVIVDELLIFIRCWLISVK